MIVFSKAIIEREALINGQIGDENKKDIIVICNKIIFIYMKSFQEKEKKLYEILNKLNKLIK